MSTIPKFKDFVLAGDSVSWEVDGFKLLADIVPDDHKTLDDDDSHNIKQCSTAQERIQCLRARKAYKNNEWFYCGVVIRVYRNGTLLCDHAASLWGIEANYPPSKGAVCDNSYLSEIAGELEEEALEAAWKAILIDQTKFAK